MPGVSLRQPCDIQTGCSLHTGRKTFRGVVCCVVPLQAPKITRRALLATPLLLATTAAGEPGQAAARSASDLIPQVQHDFQDSQYYITGRLTQDIFASDCVFKDPTTNVKGPQAYSKAVAALFDPKRSRADLISIKVGLVDPLLTPRH